MRVHHTTLHHNIDDYSTTFPRIKPQQPILPSWQSMCALWQWSTIHFEFLLISATINGRQPRSVVYTSTLQLPSL